MTEAIGVSAAWATQKIAEQSVRWKQQIKPAKPINVPPEIKASTYPVLTILHTAATRKMLAQQLKSWDDEHPLISLVRL